MEESERAYFFQSSKPLFRIQKLEEGKYRFVDEQDKIEVIASDKDVQALHNILGDTGVMKSMTKNQTIMDQIISEYQAGERDTIAGKPYVVYDIETTFDGPQLTNQHFEMAYSIASDDPHEESLPYKYIDRTSMKKYCDRLLAYDGWIVGYNQIGFDNPVLCMNVGYGEKEIEILNRKSLDPFLFLWKTLGRRISLNNASKALISS